MSQVYFNQNIFVYNCFLTSFLQTTDGPDLSLSETGRPVNPMVDCPLHAQEMQVLCSNEQQPEGIMRYIHRGVEFEKVDTRFKGFTSAFCCR